MRDCSAASWSSNWPPSPRPAAPCRSPRGWPTAPAQASACGHAPLSSIRAWRRPSRCPPGARCSCRRAAWPSTRSRPSGRQRTTTSNSHRTSDPEDVMRIVLITTAVSLGVALAPDADAQMRPGQPEVLRPAPLESVTIATPWSELRRRLGARNRVMLFWEDGLDGGVATRYRDVETLDRRVHGRAAQVGTAAHHYDGSTEVAVAGAAAHLHQRRERYADDDAPMAAALSDQARSLQSEFMAQL